jgi:RNA polymerase sigma-B factor
MMTATAIAPEQIEPADPRPSTEPASTRGSAHLASTRGDAGQDRERIILDHLDLADRLANRYRDHPNTTPDDLRQTARVALIGAVDRFDPSRGTPFVAFAITTIIGELKRYLRDATWTVRIPRSVKEHALRLVQARQRMAQSSDRWPAVGELASQLDLSQEEVTRAISAMENRTVLSLDVPIESGNADGITLGELLTDAEPEVEVEDLMVLPTLVESLPPVERTAVVLHYFRGMKQREVGDLLGCSQMQVSRLLRRSRERLRDQLSAHV